MSKKEELEISISNTGEVTINVIGAKGKSCIDMTKDLEESLGIIKSFEKKSEFYQEFISNNLGGSAQPGINAKTLSLFPINLPPLEEQKRIAQILGALDDKIELLQKQNKTLEDLFFEVTEGVDRDDQASLSDAEDEA